jgi:hypothetical protein
MKGNTTRFLISLLFVLVTFGIQAQTDMVWDAYGVGFSVPKDFVEETNNREEFTAGNDNVFLTIMPLADESLTEDDLADAVVLMAEEMEYDRIQEGDAIDIDDFTGYYVKGKKDGVNAVLLALLDKESDTNLFVAIVYTNGYEDTAVEMAASFYAYD